MDELAAALAMSKKTLYRWFPHKADLVRAALKSYLAQVRAALRQQHLESRTAPEELLALSAWVQQQRETVNQLFFQELELHFPADWQLWQDHCQGFVYNHLCANLRRGVLQHHYHPHLEVAFLGRLWLLEVSLGRNTRLHAAWGLEPAAVQHTLMAQFLLSIATPAGARLLRQLPAAQPELAGAGAC